MQCLPVRGDAPVFHHGILPMIGCQQPTSAAQWTALARALVRWLTSRIAQGKAKVLSQAGLQKWEYSLNADKSGAG